jgi:hypothetical protein
MNRRKLGWRLMFPRLKSSVNTKSQRTIILTNKAIRREHDFTYLGSNVSEDGGTRKDVETRIRKARGAFTGLRKI